jgi:peroxiredoxin
MGNRLDKGDIFPDITLNLVGGGTLDLPSGLETADSVILFYRGYW